jgi:predicted DNA-binding protein (MmcQ/YjbR family)
MFPSRDTIVQSGGAECGRVGWTAGELAVYPGGMDFETVRDHCLGKPETSEDFPFDEHTLVFRVCAKMFCLANLERLPQGINLKCDPETALDLRDRYEAVVPGWHMSKKHWNTIYLEEDASDEAILGWIDDSYDLVVTSLKKADRVRIQAAQEAS